MNLKQASAMAVVGGALFFGGLALGFSEGSNFGATLVSINSGYVAVHLLRELKNDNTQRIGAQFEFEVEAGLFAGELLQQNPYWARLGFLVNPSDPARLDLYLEKIRQYRQANAFDPSISCPKVDCTPGNSGEANSSD